MTHEQKKRIIELIQAGLKDKRIAELLGLSVNTVKSFRHRNSEQVELVKASYCICPQCGQPYANGVNGKRFCSVACKTKWWNERHDQYKNTSAIQVNCLYCGSAFTAYPKQKRKFCSHECYIAHRYFQGGVAHDKK